MTTFVRVLLTPAVSKGGLPTSKVHKMTPSLHTSVSKPWDDLVATLGEMKLSVLHIVTCLSPGVASLV